MTMELRVAGNNDSEEWDMLIRQSPHGTLFHTWKWLQIAEKHIPSRLFPLIGIENGIPVGAFPVFFQKRGPFRMVFSPLPNAVIFYLGPVLAGFDLMDQAHRERRLSEFWQCVETFIERELNAHSVSIAFSPTLKDPRPFLWSGFTLDLHYDYVIDLSRGYDILFNSLDKRQRQNISRAQKRGIVIEMGGMKEYEEIINLMSIRYAQQGKVVTPPLPYLRGIYNAFKDNFKVFYATLDNEIITGSIDFQDNDQYYSWIGSPKPVKPISPSPNDLLMGESVRFACELGVKHYTTLGAAGNMRLHSYYASKFNPSLNIRYSVNRGTVFTSMFEKGYKNIIKPLKGMVSRKTKDSLYR